MDRLTHYQNLIKQFLREFARLVNSPPSENPEMFCLFDEEQHHYLLLNVGWEDVKRIHSATLHVHLRDQKIWIEEDWTEHGLASYLVEQGVPREDIVLAFHHPNWRPYTQFAVA